MTYLTDVMKQDSGQNQFSRGEAGLGVTAASAIQALQEAGGKITRLHAAAYTESFRQTVEQMLRILSERIRARRALMVARATPGGTLRTRSVLLLPARAGQNRPPYEVRVHVQRRNPLRVQAHNEFILQLADLCLKSGTSLSPRACHRPRKPSSRRIMGAPSDQSAPQSRNMRSTTVGMSTRWPRA